MDACGLVAVGRAVADALGVTLPLGPGLLVAVDGEGEGLALGGGPLGVGLWDGG
jgi:hypothetical protein